MTFKDMLHKICNSKVVHGEPLLKSTRQERERNDYVLFRKNIGINGNNNRNTLLSRSVSAKQIRRIKV